MGKYGKCTVKGLKELQKKMEKFKQKELDQYIDACVRELAARLLSKVIKRTPVGDYKKSSGKKGGTLRRGWTTQKDGSGFEGMKTSNASACADTLKVHHFGNVYVIELINPIEYASYVEFGHRTRDHKGWVPGRFMLTISEKEIQDAAPGILERNLKKKLEEIFR